MVSSSMALETVGHVVAALGDSYTIALECYTTWRQRQRVENHYRTRCRENGDDDSVMGDSGDHGAEKRSPAFAAASASLTLSRSRVEEAFRGGVDVLGDEFISGDETCRDVLLDNLSRLRDCVAALQQAVALGRHGPLPLAKVTRVSEDVRIACLDALHKLYQRLIVARLVPRKHSSPALKPNLSAPTKGNSSNSNTGSAYSPPSPPPTPRRSADLDSELSAAGYDSRPENSVFSIFCPEAMKYQVDLQKGLPVNGAKCRCGYVWDAVYHTQDRTAMAVKEGFVITPRFLGKSHCDKGLGCVLCISNGKAETFDSVEGLKTHINASHTKWQLLHDRDLAGL
ncbi:hypothetical protein F5Y03DRAFT_284405 [Xylaria venustula]|nr:hypothetical protein F5Y03DRAFT_284405 [Xylaria venustula]